MTSKEAIEELEKGYPLEDTPTEECSKYEKAVEKAIEALKKQNGAWHIWYACPHCGEMRSKPFDTCAYCGADMRKEGGKAE